MNRNLAIREMGINQIKVINNFFDMKMEILYALLHPEDIAHLAPVQRYFIRLNDALDDMLRAMKTDPHESIAEQKLRLRGCQVFLKRINNLMCEMLYEIVELQESVMLEKRYNCYEQYVIGGTMDALLRIVDSNLYLINQEAH